MKNHEKFDLLNNKDKKEINKNEGQIIEKYEKTCELPYAELGNKPDQKWKNWGSVLYKGRQTSLYADQEIIDDCFTKKILADFPKDKKLRIIDFGGGDGIVLNSVIKELDKKGIKAIGADIDVGLKEGKTKECWSELRTKLNPKIRKRMIDMAFNIIKEKDKINIKENSIDVGLMRFSLQYTGLETRKQFLAETFKYLKPGGKLYCVWPGEWTKEQAIAINKLWANFAKITQDIDPHEFLKEKWYPTTDEVKHDSEQVGFIVKVIQEIPELESRFSLDAISNGSRFKKFTPKQTELMKNVFQELHSEYPNYIEKNNYRHPIILIILEKPKEQSKQ